MMMISLLLRSPSRPQVISRASRCALFSSVDLSQHTLNCAKALKKAVETHSFKALAKEDVSVLQGIGPERLHALHAMGIKTIEDLAKYKYYHMARSIVALAATEEAPRLPGSTMNINNALQKDHECKTFGELVDAPVASLQGLSVEKGALFYELGVVSIGDLANLKYCHWAESIVNLSKYEE